MDDKKLLAEVTEEIANKFDMPDWASEEGKEKRLEVSTALKNAMVNIGKLLGSTLNNKEKAKKIREYLKNSGWMSALWGVWKFITESSINAPKIDLRSLSVDFTDIVDFGPTFWIKVAVLLFALRIVHKVVSTGVLIINDFSWMWNWVKNIFKENVTNEGYLSFKEYKQLQILFD